MLQNIFKYDILLQVLRNVPHRKEARMAKAVETKPSDHSFKKFIKRVGEVLAAILGFVIFALVSSIPIDVLTPIIGGMKTFIIMVPLYGFGSYFITIWLVGVVDRRSDGKPSRAANWVETQREHNLKDGKKSFFWRLAETGGFVGFAIASYFLGAIITILLINYSTKIDNLKRLTAVSSLIFSVGFCATYSGLFGWIFSR